MLKGSGFIRPRGSLSRLSGAARPSKLPLTHLHIYSPPAKPHALRLQSQPLFNGRIPLQLNRATRTQHPLPRQSKPAPQNRRHLPCCSRKPGRARDPAIGRHLSPRNRTNRALDPQTHLACFDRAGFLSVRSTPCRPQIHLSTMNRGSRLCRVICGKDGDFDASRNSCRRLRKSYAAARKDSSASYSELYTSNTVNSLVTCNKSPTRLVKFASLIVPPALCAVVCNPTSVPSPPESI